MRKTLPAMILSCCLLAACAHNQAVPQLDLQAQADAFLQSYLTELATLELAQTTGYWKAANSGKEEDFAAFAEADLALRKLHSDAARSREIERLLAGREQLRPQTVRSLEIALLGFKGNQLSAETLEQMVNESTGIEQLFNTFRAELDGNKLTNNDLLDLLSVETDSRKRQAAWEATKAVGAQVAPKLVALAKLRNEAARSLGFADFWHMQVELQEHDPAQVLALFEELDRLTLEPYRAMKAELDAEIARRFSIAPAGVMPWHYTNPFFQSAPPSEAVDLDLFYKDLPKERIVELARTFYADIGLPIDEIAARSDLYDREGKDQHAFCIAIDRQGDVRTLLNVKPTEAWMETMLHEMGHAVYYAGIDKSLPFNVRESSHLFTTEAVAMLFGALSRNPLWLKSYAGADPAQVDALEKAILEQRRREQLIFVRWGLVMLHFERALYANPEQDLDALWYQTVERYQLLTTPEGRAGKGDWAAKPHFTIAPVYYHNYVLGELFAAQLRAHLAKMAGHQGPASTLSFNGRKDFGAYLDEKIFRPGMAQKWPELVELATGAPLSPEAFAAEVK
ncbi:MAG TPA: peptidase M3 [Myxococcales bacterium]|jgi:peptidyl-dipeptidase A|nr:peptidase M3 [Myxococcales bacterium]